MTKTKIRQLKRLYDKGIIDHTCLIHMVEAELCYKQKGKNVILHIADYTGIQHDTVHEEPFIRRDDTMIYYVSNYSGRPIRFIWGIHAAVVQSDNRLKCTALCGDLKYLEAMHGEDSPEAEAYRKDGWRAVQKLPIPNARANMDYALKVTQSVLIRAIRQKRR